MKSPDRLNLFTCSIPAPSAPSKTGTSGKGRKARPLSPELVCDQCSREKAIRWRDQWWCPICDEAALWPAIADHRERTAKITREVAR